jgi:bacterioferritin
MSLEYIKGIQQQIDINQTIKMLRSALAAELNASHNYWTQSKIIQGVHSDLIRKELIQHQQEENQHAEMLVNRILQLGGNPEIRPLDWDKHTPCRYELAGSWDEKAILEVATRGEKCAIADYTKTAEFLKNRDDTSYDMVMHILEDEYEHVRDLNKLYEESTAIKESKHSKPNNKSQEQE